MCLQLKQLFGFCGQVVSCTLVGNQRQYALVEYKTPGVSSVPSERLHTFQLVDPCAGWLSFAG